MTERKTQKHNRRYSQKQRIRQRKRNLRLLILALAAVLLIVGIRYLMLGRYVKKHDNGRILQGVYVGTANVSGMTEDEALKAVQTTVEKQREKTVALSLDGERQFEASLGELGLKADDFNETVQKAVRYGKSGNAFQSYKVLRQSEKGELKQEFPLKYSVSEKSCKEILGLKAAEFLHTPVNAAVTQQDGAVTIVPEQDGEVLDVKATVKAIQEFLNKNQKYQTVKLDAVVKNTKPEITVEKLTDVTDLLGSYSTFYGSDGSGRSQNVETGANHIGGHLLQPGEEMSADEAMRPYTFENGYAEAASYESNKVVQSMGGGICQVSTTLYNALLYAELEIVERYPHSMQVSYVDASKDAAIADDLLDLVFKNDKKYPIYIESVLSGGSLTFNIYGKETRTPGRTLEFVSEITDTKEPEGKRFLATEDGIGYFGLQSGAHSAVTAQLWKVVYQDGVEVSRDIVNYSQYASAPETYGVGTSSDNPEAAAKINSAIQSQDENKIQAAIQEILYGAPAAAAPQQ